MTPIIVSIEGSFVNLSHVRYAVPTADENGKPNGLRLVFGRRDGEQAGYGFPESNPDYFDLNEKQGGWVARILQEYTSHTYTQEEKSDDIPTVEEPGGEVQAGDTNEVVKDDLV